MLHFCFGCFLGFFFRSRYFYIQNRAFLHGNLYSHRDLYIQVAHAFVFDGAGTLDHNSLVCLNSFRSLCLKSSQKICDYFLQLRFCLVGDLPFGPDRGEECLVLAYYMS